jgi:hypothetical protein
VVVLKNDPVFVFIEGPVGLVFVLVGGKPPVPPVSVLPPPKPVFEPVSVGDGVSVPAEVLVVEVPVKEAVGSTVMHEPTTLMTLVSKVTAPFRANRPP